MGGGGGYSDMYCFKMRRLWLHVFFICFPLRTVSGFYFLSDYGLVVICNSENEDRANIVAALDQYRVTAPPRPSPEDMSSYLKHQFQAPPSQYGYIGSSKITWTTAGSLDPEK